MHKNVFIGMRKKKIEELNRLSISEFKTIEKIPITLVLDNIRSLNNIGSIFRTADAFLIDKIFLCGITAQPPHRDIQKTALGATESVDWEYRSSITELIVELRQSGHHIIAVEQADNSISLNQYSFEPEGSYCLIFGNEVKGVGDEAMKMVDGCIEIPQHGTKHSLNISIAAGIVIWQVYQSFKN